jgi:hypothetical protein
MNPAERDKVSVGDRVVYYGNGLVFGVFEVVGMVDNQFKGWQKTYPFQLKIQPLEIPNNPIKRGILAKPLADKISLQKAKSGSPNLIELSETEFEQIISAIKNGEEVKFK